MSGRFDPRLWGLGGDGLDDLFGRPVDLPTNLDEMLIASGRPDAPPVLIGGQGAGDVSRGFGADPTPLQPYTKESDLLYRPTDPQPTLDDLVVRAGDPRAAPVLLGANTYRRPAAAGPRNIELAPRTDSVELAPTPDIADSQSIQTPKTLEAAPTLPPYLVSDWGVINSKIAVPDAFPETYFRIDSGVVTPVQPKSEKKTDDSFTAIFDPEVYSGAQGVAHTHPLGDNAKPWPGLDDDDIPRRLKIPLYGIVPERIWRVNPPGPDGRVTVELIQGEWGASAKDVQRAIDALNTPEHISGRRRSRR